MVILRVVLQHLRKNYLNEPLIGHGSAGTISAFEQFDNALLVSAT